MKKITENEAKKLIKEGCGCGNFMGGFAGDKKKPFIEYVGNEIWLIERNEVNSEKYKNLLKRQAKESKEYCEIIYEGRNNT